MATRRNRVLNIGAMAAVMTGIVIQAPPAWGREQSGPGERHADWKRSKKSRYTPHQGAKEKAKRKGK